MRLAFFQWCLALSANVDGASAAWLRGFGELDLRDLSPGKAHVGHFDQYIDHQRPERGTFRQKYMWSAEYYGGPGSPVVLTTPGEVALTDTYRSYFNGSQIIYGAFAKAIGGAMVMLEHRYFGHSSPYNTLSTKNMRYLTLENSIADLNHFARTANLPFDANGDSKADKAPWVLSGCSYAGALTAWTEETGNSAFWAFHSSSGVVQAIYDFWEYYAPAATYMPQKCFDALSLVVEHVDEVLSKGTREQVRALKEMFWLQHLEHDSDFAAALSSGPQEWQVGYSLFTYFCEYLAPGDGQPQVDEALQGYSRWFTKYHLPEYCRKYLGGFRGKGSTLCLSLFDTHNATSIVYTDKSLQNHWQRSWMWMLCNEPFGWWPTGSDSGGRGRIVSRYITAESYQRTCSLYFPPQDGVTIAEHNSVAKLNARTQGWKKRDSQRLMYVNGEIDSWRGATVASVGRPGGPLKSTPSVPSYMIPRGNHCADINVKGVTGETKAVIDKEVETMKGWVETYYEAKKIVAAVENAFEANQPQFPRGCEHHEQ